MKSVDIIILSKVVDNFGDIGVCWRLAKKIRDYNSSNKNYKIEIRFVTDNLESFSKINNKIDSTLPFQNCDEIKIYDWNNSDFCYKSFSENPPKIILECFQCGRPEWLEKILFDDKLSHIVNIIMIDYLTAEDYAENFHCLQSITRSAKVKKINFMPGFTEKTGGLLLPPPSVLPLPAKNFKKSTSLEILFFAYESNWDFFIKAINKLENASDIKINVAAGAGQKSFLESVKKIGATFSIIEHKFMNQENWDLMMKNCDALFVRGEDSMAQAASLGIPFIWQAYPQSENYQTVKVYALLEKMKNFFGDEFCFVREVWEIINKIKNASEIEYKNSVYKFMAHLNELKNGYKNFSKSILKNGDLSYNLMTFIEKSDMIDL